MRFTAPHSSTNKRAMPHNKNPDHILRSWWESFSEKGKVVPVLNKVPRHEDLWALDRGEWSASRPGRFTPREKTRHPLDRKSGETENWGWAYTYLPDALPYWF